MVWECNPPIIETKIEKGQFLLPFFFIYNKTIVVKKKAKLRFNLFKIFSKRYNKLFNRLFDHKLNDNLLYFIKNKVKLDVIYDIGAFKGEWSALLNNTSLKNKQFFLFEANKENEDYLKKTGFKYFFEILSDKEKEVKFFSLVSTGDSYYQEQTNIYSNEVQPKLKKTSSLDNVIKINQLPLPNFIKIDTQGSELDILKGAKNSLDECSLILLECPVIEYNKNSPYFKEYIDFMNTINFIPYDLVEVHKMDNVLIQIEVLFIKKSLFDRLNLSKKILNIFKRN